MGIHGLEEGVSISLEPVASVDILVVVPFACEGSGTSIEVFRRVAMLIREVVVLLMPATTVVVALQGRRVGMFIRSFAMCDVGSGAWVWRAKWLLHLNCACRLGLASLM